MMSWFFGEKGLEAVNHADQGFVAVLDKVLPELLSSLAGEHAVTVLILARNGKECVERVQAHWLREEVSQRRLHLVAFEQELDGEVDQTGIPRLPGVHRSDLQGGTITRLVGPFSNLLPQLVATPDLVLVGGPAPLTTVLHYADILVRLAAPQFQVLAPASVIRNIQAAVRKKGAKQLDVQQAGDAWQILSARLHKRAKPPAPANRTAWVIGGSLAGAGVAYALALRGWRVHVTDPSLAPGARAPHAGHLAAAMTPLISSDDNFKARLSRAGIYRAHDRWAGFGPHIIPSRSGTLELARTSGHARDLMQAVQNMAFPQAWVHLSGADQSHEHTGVAVTRDGAFFGRGLTVSPPALIRKLLSHPNIECHGQRIHSLRKSGQGWQLCYRGNTEAGNSDVAIEVDAGNYADDAADAADVARGDLRILAECEVVILAAASHTPQLLAKSGLDTLTRRSGRKDPALPAIMSMDTLGGQVMHVPVGMLPQVPATVIGAEGYFLPPIDGHCVLGSTYEPRREVPPLTLEGQRQIVSKLAGALAPEVLKTVRERLETAEERSKAQSEAPFPGWSGSRAVIRGRLPAFGPVPGQEGLWLACGYASHGLTWSALAGDVIAAMLCAEPVPLEQDLLQAVAPR